MNNSVLAALGATMIAASPGVMAAQQQSVRVYSTEPRGYAFSTAEDETRAVIGITTSTGSARDTLGVLVTSVTAGGPAERAGLEEGNRIASINGVNLKLAAADVGDWDMANAMSRRLTRELGKVKAGDEVELRVYSSGQTRSVRVKTVQADSLYRTTRRTRFDADDRAAIGISLGSSASRRDTLGVLIMGLDDDGPAAKAGLEEGNRIVSINGVDLRASRDDAGDDFISSAKISRLNREMEKVKPGDEVALRVYTGAGRVRDLRIKTVALSDLPGRRTFIGREGFPMPMRAPGTPLAPGRIEFRRLEEELERAGRRIEEIAPRIQGWVSRRVSM